MVKTRIKVRGGRYCVQRKVRVLCIFRRWEDVASFGDYAEALMFQATWVPREIFDRQRIMMTS